jgi:Ca2+/Na+ antiporter
MAVHVNYKLAFLLLASLIALGVGRVCTGECDVDSCDFLEDMCLNKIDMKSGDFSLPHEPCQPTGGGMFLEVFLFFYSMLALAIVCDDYLCVALERLCEEFLIREDVAGATFMAFGSAAPEVILNTIGTIKQVRSWPPSSEALEATNLGVGAILGSGMIAFLVIPGACALSTEGGVELLLKRRPLLRDVAAYAISLILLCIFFSDGVIETYEGAILVAFYVVYVITVFFSPSIRQWYVSVLPYFLPFLVYLFVITFVPITACLPACIL